MPVETATYVSQLNPSYPLHTDGLNQADSHLRLIKQAIQNTFPNLGTVDAVTATADQITAAGVAFATPGELVVSGGTATTTSLFLDGSSNGGYVLIQNNTGTAASGSLAIFTGGGGTVGLTGSMTLSSGTLAPSAAVSAPSIQKNGSELLPAGCIVMWSGSASAIPAGWALCNGSSGTPDLRGKFIIGAGGSYAVAQTGGAASATVTTDTQGSHSHTGGTGLGGGATVTGTTDTQGAHSHGGADQGHALTVAELPPHTHGYLGIGAGTALPGGSGYGLISEQTDSGSGTAGAQHSHAITTDGAHQHNLTISAVPAHNHAITLDGAHYHNVSVNTLPPFYALCFIMKL